MPVNALTTEAGLKIGPIVLETLIKHYFDRIKNRAEENKANTKLRRDELLYDEAFNVVKKFLAAATLHTVEEVQDFGNTRMPSPPWVHVVRVLVPMSCCDDAAAYLIKAFGGEETAKHVVGGVKWWQVRGVEGVDGQWVVARKDWREAKRRHKMYEASRNKDDLKTSSETSVEPTDSGIYKQEMDEMRCILYTHGGGYYFGSVDQERYSIQRHARKINGRVFAVNYRLAPQYPFPCALQDVLAAYLFLIRPPTGASHRPVKPSHIIIAGDSAGGGLSLALLQLLRDAGLPMPAGGVLISPWCDLTHSFPSTHINTDTDVIPVYGLSMQKPSTLWPPPSNEMTSHVHASLRSRIRHSLRRDDHSTKPESPSVLMQPHANESGMPVDIGATAPLPPLHSPDNQTITLIAKCGETLIIDQQVHMYAQNSLLAHPLVSPAFSYLGGLPPLLFIAGNGEVIRDEIIYTAHKAAHPERFPLKEESRKIYPPLKSIEKRHAATSVHLQVYDDTAHILPVLFSFSTPGKFCYRAIATFCRHVTGMSVTVPHSPIDGVFPSGSMSIPELSSMAVESQSSIASNGSARGSQSQDVSDSCKPSPRKGSVRRSLNLIRAASSFRKHSNPRSFSSEQTGTDGLPSSTGNSSSSDVGGSRFRGTFTPQERTAGDAVVYSETPAFPSWKGQMIRERVSTQGVIRPLEPEGELDAFQLPPEILGVLSELAVRRYLDGKAKFDAKFAGTIKTIEKERRRNLDRAKTDREKGMSKNRGVVGLIRGNTVKRGKKEGPSVGSDSWGYAWALDADEMPPPSSIVSRRDTEEARRLAKIADQCVLQEDTAMSANSLWAVMNNFLTVSPDRDDKNGHTSEKPMEEVKEQREKSRLSRFIPG